jgi:hypothetical protein
MLEKARADLFAAAALLQKQPLNFREGRPGALRRAGQRLAEIEDQLAAVLKTLRSEPLPFRACRPPPRLTIVTAV